jgi:predicted Zn-dependent protease
VRRGPAIVAAAALAAGGLACRSAGPAAPQAAAPAGPREPAGRPDVQRWRDAAARLFGRDPLSRDQRLLRYVNLVGRALAGPAYRFAVTQSDVPYTLGFAGGFVAVSRGALFLMSSEAELAVGLSREICRLRAGALPESLESDPRGEENMDACGAGLASSAGYDASAYLHYLQSLQSRSISARERNDLQARMERYRSLPDVARGGVKLVERFRRSVIL